MNRNEFVDIVYSYAHRAQTASFTDLIVTQFIPLGEALIGRNLRSKENETLLEYDAADPGYTMPLALPADYGSVQYLRAYAAGGDRDLVAVPAGQITRYDVTGPGEVYYISNGVIDVRGRAEARHDLSYWFRPSFVDDTTDNPVAATWPDLYLAATLTFLLKWARDENWKLYEGEVMVATQQIWRDTVANGANKPVMRRV